MAMALSFKTLSALDKSSASIFHGTTRPVKTSDYPRKILPMIIRAVGNVNPPWLGDQKLICISEDDRLFEPYMAVKKKRLNEALEAAVPLRHPLRIHESMRYSLLAWGKHVRPILCLAACELVGGDESQAMPMACAVEMVHIMSLVHDDLPCMDDDDLRRGQPANHKAFDVETALLAGNALLCLAFEHVASCTKNVSPERLVWAIQELGFAAGSEGIQGGQMMDKLYEGRNDVTLKEIKDMQTLKSGKIAAAAVVCGAIVGGGNEDEIERLRRLGTKAGFLFQVVDDIIDLTKPSEVLGKKAESDLAKDKATYPKLMGIEGAKKYAVELWNDVLQELSFFDAERAAPLRGAVRYIFNLQN